MYTLLLDNIKRHIAITPEEEEYFISLLQHRKLRKRQYLIQEGDVAKYENFVIKGCLRAYSVDEKGQEHIIQFAEEDWWIGDMYSYTSGEPAIFNVDALEDSELLQISPENQEQLFKAYPKFERFFRIIIQNGFIALQRRVIANMSQPAEERYLDFAKKYPSILNRVPQHQVASYLGITPEFLSRIRKQVVNKS